MEKYVEPNSGYITLGERAFHAKDMKNALNFAVQELRQNPYSKEAYTLAGRVMQAVDNWPNAASYYLNALRIDPFYKPTQILFLEHYVNSCFEGYDIALIDALNRIPDHSFAIDALLNHHYGCHHWETLYSLVDRVVMQENVSIAFKCKAALMWMLAKFIAGNTEIHYLTQAQHSNGNILSETEQTIMSWVTSYHILINQLIAFKKELPAYYEHPPADKLYVIGESHALSCTHLNIKLAGAPLHCSVQHIIGIKANHFSKSHINAHLMMHYFERTISGIPRESKVLIMIGEIDCRVDEGILPYAFAHQKTIAETVDQTVHGYVKCLHELNTVYRHHVILCTVPPLNIQLLNEEKKQQFLQLKEVIKLFNDKLKKYAEEYGFVILDTYTQNIADNGFAKPGVHIDNFHLKPSVIAEAIANYR